jgi:hypothetical protein
MTKHAPYKCFFYYLIEPVRNRVADDGQHILFECIDGHPIKIAFLTYEDNQPMALRFEFNVVEEGKIPDSTLDIMHTAKEHFLSTFQLVCGESIHYFDATMCQYLKLNSKPDLNLQIQIQKQSYSTNKELLRNCFTKGMKHHHLLQLLAHGTNIYVPLPLRYLSLFNLFEHKFKTKGKWNKNKVIEFLEPYKQKWEAKKINKSPYALIHDIRDRCTHAKTNSDRLGIISLKRKDTVDIVNILPDMSEMGQKIIEDLTNKAFQFVKPN